MTPSMRMALGLAICAGLPLTGCEGDKVTTLNQPSSAPVEMSEGIAGTQIDRAGRPGITTVLLHDVNRTTSNNNRDAWNAQTPDGDGAGTASTAAKAKIDALLGLGTPRTVNGVLLDAATLKAVLVDGGDVLKIDVAGTTTGFLGAELGVAGSFGGRGLAEDVVNTELTVLTGGAVTTDRVDANDRTFLTVFPYLAAPQANQPSSAPIAMSAGIAGTQIDRAGRPGITTVLLHDVNRTTSNSNRDAWNGQAPNGDAAGTASTAAKAKIDALLTLGTPQTVNGVLLNAATLKAVLVDGGDVLKIDVAGTTTGFLEAELGVAGSFGGRGLAEDVVNTELTVLTGGAVTTDLVNANDRTFLTVFPYLAAPQ